MSGKVLALENALAIIIGILLGEFLVFIADSYSSFLVNLSGLIIIIAIMKITSK